MSPIFRLKCKRRFASPSFALLKTIHLNFISESLLDLAVYFTPCWSFIKRLFLVQFENDQLVKKRVESWRTWKKLEREFSQRAKKTTKCTAWDKSETAEISSGNGSNKRSVRRPTRAQRPTPHNMALKMYSPGTLVCVTNWIIADKMFASGSLAFSGIWFRGLFLFLLHK